MVLGGKTLGDDGLGDAWRCLKVPALLSPSSLSGSNLHLWRRPQEDNDDDDVVKKGEQQR